MSAWESGGEEPGSEAPSAPEKQPEECGAEEGLLGDSMQEKWEQGEVWLEKSSRKPFQVNSRSGKKASGWKHLHIALCKQLLACGPSGGQLIPEPHLGSMLVDSLEPL